MCCEFEAVHLPPSNAVVLSSSSKKLMRLCLALSEFLDLLGSLFHNASCNIYSHKADFCIPRKSGKYSLLICVRAVYTRLKTSTSTNTTAGAI